MPSSSQSSSQLVRPEIESSSQLEIESIAFKWIIPNYTKYTEKDIGYSLKSPAFSHNFDGLLACKWYIQIYPNGVLSEHEHSLSLFVYHSLSEVSMPRGRDALMACQISILNSKCEKKFERETISNGSGWPEFVKTETLLDKKNGLLPSNSLTICCKIYYSEVNKEIAKCCLIQNLSDLLKSELLTDVTLVVQDKEFKVHKNILAARSPVFAAIFTTNVNEKSQNIVEIADIDTKVVRSMLHYIYSGDFPTEKSVELSCGLLVAADKYDLTRLKMLCEQNLYQNLTIDNGVELLILAQLYNASELKKNAMAFVVDEISNVMKTEKWSSLARNHARLLDEIFANHVQSVIARK